MLDVVMLGVMAPLSVLYSKVKTLALPTNVRLSLKAMPMTNTLAYFDNTSVTETENIVILTKENKPMKHFSANVGVIEKYFN
jgi:hypothetical protein